MNILNIFFSVFQDVAENLNMAKMNLSPSIEEKSSTREKTEDQNGIDCHRWIIKDVSLSILEMIIHPTCFLISGNLEEGPSVEVLSVSPKANLGLSKIYFSQMLSLCIEVHFKLYYNNCGKKN